MHIQKRLFTPIQIGLITLKHRVVMPPMSRLRAQWPSGIPSDLQLEYYRQRASDGGLIFTEATAISTSGRGYKGAPELYSDEQVTGWKRSTDAVHAKGGYIFTFGAPTVLESASRQAGRSTTWRTAIRGRYSMRTGTPTTVH